MAVLLVKPVGVSTQFSVLSGIIHSALDDAVITQAPDRDAGYASRNAYYDRNDGKLAGAIKNPWDYGFVFVLAIPLGYPGLLFVGVLFMAAACVLPAKQRRTSS